MVGAGRAEQRLRIAEQLGHLRGRLGWIQFAELLLQRLGDGFGAHLEAAREPPEKVGQALVDMGDAEAGVADEGVNADPEAGVVTRQAPGLRECTDVGLHEQQPVAAHAGQRHVVGPQRDPRQASRQRPRCHVRQQRGDRAHEARQELLGTSLARCLGLVPGGGEPLLQLLEERSPIAQRVMRPGGAVHDRDLDRSPVRSDREPRCGLCGELGDARQFAERDPIGGRDIGLGPAVGGHRRRELLGGLAADRRRSEQFGQVPDQGPSTERVLPAARVGGLIVKGRIGRGHACIVDGDTRRYLGVSP